MITLVPPLLWVLNGWIYHSCHVHAHTWGEISAKFIENRQKSTGKECNFASINTVSGCFSWFLEQLKPTKTNLGDPINKLVYSSDQFTIPHSHYEDTSHFAMCTLATSLLPQRSKRKMMTCQWAICTHLSHHCASVQLLLSILSAVSLRRKVRS